MACPDGVYTDWKMCGTASGCNRFCSHLVCLVRVSLRERGAMIIRTSLMFAVLIGGCCVPVVSSSEVSDSAKLWLAINEIADAKDVGQITRLEAGLGKGRVAGLVRLFAKGFVISGAVNPKMGTMQRVAMQREHALVISDYLDKNFLELRVGLEDNAELLSEAAKWMAIAGRVAAAIAMIDEYGSRAKAEDQVVAAIAASQLQAYKDSWESAKKISVNAINLADNLYVNSNESAVKMLRSRARVNNDRIQRLADIAIHGLGFRLYYEANIQRLQYHNYEKALGVYEKLLRLSDSNKNTEESGLSLVWADDATIDSLPIHPVYAAAGRYGSLCCRYALGSLDPRQEFVRKACSEVGSPFFPANNLLLVDSLIASGLVKDAEVALVASLRWLGSPVVDDQYAIPKQSRERTRPSGAMRAATGMGRVTWFDPSPSELYTLENCPWWADYVSMQCKKSLSLIRFMQKDKDQALQLLGEALRYDQIDNQYTQKGIPSNYLRLRDGIQAGGFFATDQEMAAFPPSALPALFLSEWKFECEEWGDAINAYDRVAKMGKLQPAALAYIDFAKASAYIYAENNGKAKELLTKFTQPNSTYKKAPSYPRALFALGSVAKDERDSIKTWSEIYDLDCSPTYKGDVCMAIGQTALAIGDFQTARSAFSRAVSLSGRGSARYDVAMAFIEKTKEREAKTSEQPKEAKP